MYACLYAAGYDDQRRAAELAENSSQKRICGLSGSALIVVAQQFSPRYESRGDCIVIDVRGLERLLGGPKAIGDELRREAADRGLRVHVAIASTRTAATMLAMSRPGVVVIAPGGEAAAIAPVPVDLLANIDHDDQRRDRKERRENNSVQDAAISAISALKRWGIRTLGDLAALPADALSARLGQDGVRWQAIARGADARPLVPDVEDERFESALELEWPIEGLEPLSFVLTRLLEPLSLRLEQRDRGVAVLHVQLRLVTKATHARRLELPSPMREVKTLRTLALLDLEAHPPPGDNIAIDRVALVVDPTPGRVWQHTLFARPHPTPAQLSTLLARLGAAVGQDRIGAPVIVDSHRPGAFAMKPFATEHGRGATLSGSPSGGTGGTALRRCRQPVPARVAIEHGRPVKVTTDRRSFAGGAVLQAAGPWKTSGEWWLEEAGRAGQAGWDRDEWDVSLGDGGAYRVFLDRATGRWFIDAILD
jgi:protein ImuB